MRRRLTIYTTIIIFAGLLCFFAASVYNNYVNNLRYAENTIAEITQIYANLYGKDPDLSKFVRAGSDTRVTIIAPDGSVIAESSSLDPLQLESHIDRPEIIAAANDSPAVHMRYSSSLGTYYLYYALKADIETGDAGTGGPDGGDEYVFIRTSIPVANIDTYLYQSLPVLVIVFCAIALMCFILTRTVVAAAAKPLETVKLKLSRLSEGKNRQVPPAGKAGDFEEIDAIVREIDDVARVLQQNIKALQDERDKVEYILNNIGDAIIAVSASKDIALVNNAAQGIFAVTPSVAGKNINYLTGNKTLLDAIDDCIDRHHSTLSELSMDGRTYILTIKNLENTQLTMVILSDITDSRENAKRREEFFENASHELKTPLTAIRGFGELCELNNKDEGIRKYIEGITRETDRMLTLIGDMLRLSELSHTAELNTVPVSLYDVASEIGEIFSAAISEKNITFEITGENMDALKCVAEAEPGHVFDMLKNLIENAVRYNNQDGSVTVMLKTDGLKVTDTGIGIPLEAQTRLFERFYRVEKSRSIQSGGTGLGLAIVRHICNLYGWKLSLKSRPGVGTEVTVEF